MTDRAIYCESCDCYLGTIRDAKLRRDLVVLCGGCYLPVSTQGARTAADDAALKTLRKMLGICEDGR